MEEKEVSVKVSYDYPTIEGMIYKDTKIKVDRKTFNELKHDEKVKGKTDVGKIVWIPRKLLEEIKWNLYLKLFWLF